MAPSFDRSHDFILWLSPLLRKDPEGHVRPSIPPYPCACLFANRQAPPFFSLYFPPSLSCAISLPLSYYRPIPWMIFLPFSLLASESFLASQSVRHLTSPSRLHFNLFFASHGAIHDRTALTLYRRWGNAVLNPTGPSPRSHCASPLPAWSSLPALRLPTVGVGGGLATEQGVSLVVEGMAWARWDKGAGDNGEGLGPLSCSGLREGGREGGRGGVSARRRSSRSMK